ncbi:hypothetical protein V4_1746 [Lactococcus cremoris]|nr:hypothetical protein V4_1746 [Lactococcus cremoris]
MFFISFTSQELRAIVQVIFIILINKKISEVFMSSVWYKSTLLTSQSVHTNKKILNREIKNH